MYYIDMMDGWFRFNGILSMQVAAISCLKKFKVYLYSQTKLTMLTIDVKTDRL